jgi:hypothetical protein
MGITPQITLGDSCAELGDKVDLEVDFSLDAGSSGGRERGCDDFIER